MNSVRVYAELSAGTSKDALVALQVLSVGPTGTGKTLTVASKLTSGMPKDFIPDFIVFSAKTSANQTQDLIDAKLDKR